MEPNPYESPKVPEPLTAGAVVRRSIGAGTILLLTPVAVIIAFGGSCAATNAFVSTNLFDLGTAIFVGFSIFLIPPAVVLIGMIWWAGRENARAKAAARDKRTEEKRGDS